MKDESLIADELMSAVRDNPKATSELEKLRDAMRDLAQLRAAGVAKGAPALKPPHSGRYDDPPKAIRTAVLGGKPKQRA